MLTSDVDASVWREFGNERPVVNRLHERRPIGAWHLPKGRGTYRRAAYRRAVPRADALGRDVLPSGLQGIRHRIQKPLTGYVWNNESCQWERD